MGCAGHPDVKTPYLDTLASKGVRFENAYSACPSCVPARAALHTGLTQESHRRVGYADGIRWEYPHTMAGELTKAGYYTQCVGKMHVDPLRNYLGFCHVELHDGYLHYYRDPEIPYRENQKQADDYFHWLKQEKGIDCDVTDTGLECNSWVQDPGFMRRNTTPPLGDGPLHRFPARRDPDMPFFLFTSYLRPHPPFDAPQCYFDMYRNKELTPPVVGDWCDEEALRARGRIFDSDTGPLDPELVREMQIGYYACITHLDHQIGRLIQALVENKLYDDTIILFVSDHGELLGDHHLFRKSRAYQGSSRVPFLVSGGGFRPEKPGSVKTDVVELRDVMPTVLEAAGVQIPDSVEGISLWNTALKESGTPEVREYLHGEHTLGEASSHWIITKTKNISGTPRPGEEQYFRIAEDPDELHNLIGSETAKERVEALRGLLIQELQDREEGFVREGRLVTGCEPIVWLTKGK